MPAWIMGATPTDLSGDFPSDEFFSGSLTAAQGHQIVRKRKSHRALIIKIQETEQLLRVLRPL